MAKQIRVLTAVRMLRKQNVALNIRDMDSTEVSILDTKFIAQEQVLLFS